VTSIPVLMRSMHELFPGHRETSECIRPLGSKMANIHRELNARHFVISYCSAAKFAGPVARRGFVLAAKMLGGQLIGARCAARRDLESPRYD
jgi:hypothetical protein